jgi:transcription termination factor Rho
MGEELYQLSLADLKELAKQKGIKGVSKLKKEELIEVINGEKAVEPEPVETMIPVKTINIKIEESEIQPNNKDDFIVEGVLEVLPDGYGFLRGENYLSTPKDVYVSPVQIRRFKLDTGDKLKGIGRSPKEGERFPALIYVNSVNGDSPDIAIKRKNFDDLIPVFPNRRKN